MTSEGLAITLFIMSITIAIILIFRGINIALAILVAYLIYTIPVLGIDSMKTVIQTIDISTLNTLSSLILAMMLAELYRELRISEEVIKALEKADIKLASIAIPMIIGLIPMPGGAYISAVMVNPIYDSIGLRPEEKTFVNFWFRHVWVSVWPLYQAIILSSAILGVNFIEIIKYTWIVTLATMTSGLIITQKMFPKAKFFYNDGRYRDLVHVWPFIVLAVLSLATPIPLPISIILLIAILVAVYRPNVETIYKALRYSLNSTFIAFIILSLMFSNSIKISGLAETLIKYLQNFTTISVALIPFSVIIATGFEFTFVALTFPILKPLLQGYNLTLAFLGGVIGSMLSPTHACLVLSSQYFKSPIKKVYKYTIPASILSIIITTTILLFYNSIVIMR